MFRSTIATVILAIVFFFAQKLPWGNTFIHPDIWYILGFYLALSYLIDQLMYQGFRKNREKFVQFYMAVSITRFVLCCIFVGVFLYLRVPDQPLFLLDFFGLYLFYTCFEIWGIYRKLRAN